MPETGEAVEAFPLALFTPDVFQRWLASAQNDTGLDGPKLVDTAQSTYGTDSALSSIAALGWQWSSMRPELGETLIHSPYLPFIPLGAGSYNRLELVPGFLLTDGEFVEGDMYTRSEIVQAYRDITTLPTNMYGY
jgi:hypothetical protein